SAHTAAACAWRHAPAWPQRCAARPRSVGVARPSRSMPSDDRSASMGGMSVSGLLPRVIFSRNDVLLATLLVTGFLAGCGPSAGSAAQPSAAEPQPTSTSRGQPDDHSGSQVVAVEPTEPGDAPPAVVAQPVSQPEPADTPEARRAELSAI